MNQVNKALEVALKGNEAHLTKKILSYLGSYGVCDCGILDTIKNECCNICWMENYFQCKGCKREYNIDENNSYQCNFMCESLWCIECANDLTCCEHCGDDFCSECSDEYETIDEDFKICSQCKKNELKQKIYEFTLELQDIEAKKK